MPDTDGESDGVSGRHSKGRMDFLCVSRAPENQVSESCCLLCKFKGLATETLSKCGKNEVIQMLCERMRKENDVMHKLSLSFSKGTFLKGRSEATWEL